MISDELAIWMKRIEREIEKLKVFEVPKVSSGWVYLLAPLTSTSWDGDSYSTTAKTLIDLSVVFGVPAGVKAILVRVACRDSASAATSGLFTIISPNNTAGDGPLIARPSGRTNDYYEDLCEVVPCNTNGDVYYQIAASGAATMDVNIQIWGYELP